MSALRQASGSRQRQGSRATYLHPETMLAFPRCLQHSGAGVRLCCGVQRGSQNEGAATLFARSTLARFRNGHDRCAPLVARWLVECLGVSVNGAVAGGGWRRRRLAALRPALCVPACLWAGVQRWACVQASSLGAFGCQTSERALAPPKAPMSRGAPVADALRSAQLRREMYDTARRHGTSRRLLCCSPRAHAADS